MQLGGVITYTRTIIRVMNSHSLRSPRQQQEQRREDQLRCAVSNNLLKRPPTPYPRKTIRDLRPCNQVPRGNLKTFQGNNVPYDHLPIAAALVGRSNV